VFRKFNARPIASVWDGQFPALCGDAGNRQVVGTNYDSSNGDQVVWRDAATGEEVASSAWLDPHFNDSTVGPGFDGKFYYLAQGHQSIVEAHARPGAEAAMTCAASFESISQERISAYLNNRTQDTGVNNERRFDNRRG
jgi:hypothetical protein